MFRSVLVGVDGSAAAAVALGRAVDIVQASQGRIGLLAAASPVRLWSGTAPFGILVAPGRLEHDVEAEAVRRVDDAAEAVPADVPVSKLVVRARLAPALLTQAREGRWDLVVVGVPSDVCRWRAIHDVSARLLRSSGVPVLVVRAAGLR